MFYMHFYEVFWAHLGSTCYLCLICSSYTALEKPRLNLCSNNTFAEYLFEFVFAWLTRVFWCFRFFFTFLFDHSFFIFFSFKIGWFSLYILHFHWWHNLGLIPNIPPKMEICLIWAFSSPQKITKRHAHYLGERLQGLILTTIWYRPPRPPNSMVRRRYGWYLQFSVYCLSLRPKVCFSTK